MIRLRTMLALACALALALSAAAAAEPGAEQPTATGPESGFFLTEEPERTNAPGTAEPTAATEPEGDPLVPEGGEVPSILMHTPAPALPLTGVRIGIDPGHQAHGNSEQETVAPGSSKKKAKVSSGTAGTYTRIAEYVTVLEISLKLRETLEAQGAEVYMTRETHDVDISNQERARMMNELGVDLVLRIHCDGADNQSKHGIALYCSRSNSIADESYRAAEAILPAMCEATGAQNNGIYVSDNYTGQNWSEVPCVMVECGFMSNLEEDLLLNEENYQWLLAEGMTQGIMSYIAERDAEGP